MVVAAGRKQGVLGALVALALAHSIGCGRQATELEASGEPPRNRCAGVLEPVDDEACAHAPPEAERAKLEAWRWPSTSPSRWLMRKPVEGDACEPAIRAYDPVTLERVWFHSLYYKATVVQAFERGKLLIMRLDDEHGSPRIKALSVENGFEGWDFGAIRTARDGLKAWDLENGLALAWQSSYERAGHLVLLEHDSGHKRWEKVVTSYAVLDALGEARVLTATTDGSELSFALVDLPSGEAVWTTPIGKLALRDPGIDYDGEGGLNTCCDDFKLGAPQILVTDGFYPGRLRALDARTGALQWSLSLPFRPELPDAKLEGEKWTLPISTTGKCSTPKSCAKLPQAYVVDSKSGRLVSSVAR